MKKIRLTRPDWTQYIEVSSETDPLGAAPRRFHGPLVIEGDFEIEEVDDNRYVGVQFIGGYRQDYTYIDPSGDLRKGDLVEVPTSNSLELQVARVTALDVPPFGVGVKSVARRLVSVSL